MGGSFGAGFLSGSLGSYLGSSGHSKNMFEMIGNTARDAVVGGTISVIGGGKFANGAQTGAFRYVLVLPEPENDAITWQYFMPELVQL
jgi:hypothetical protein